MEQFIKMVLALGLVYLIASFIGGTWDPMEWHWVLKTLAVLFALNAFHEIGNE